MTEAKTPELDQTVSAVIRLLDNCRLWYGLYAFSKLRVDLMNERADTFFGTFQAVFRDHILLELSALTDRATQGNQENLSVRWCLDHYMTAASEKESRRLARAVDHLEKAVSAIRQHRNKRIAHRDVAVYTSQSAPLEGLIPHRVWSCCRLAAAILQRVSQAAGNPPFIPETIGADPPTTILENLYVAKKYEQLNDEIESGRLVVNDQLKERVFDDIMEFSERAL